MDLVTFRRDTVWCSLSVSLGSPFGVSNGENTLFTHHFLDDALPRCLWQTSPSKAPCDSHETVSVASLIALHPSCCMRNISTMECALVKNTSPSLPKSLCNLRSAGIQALLLTGLYVFLNVRLSPLWSVGHVWPTLFNSICTFQPFCLSPLPPAHPLHS